jgi:citronellol/citronellal dehydrogenase
MSDERTMKSKIAIVTGASRGIGKAISLAYAKEGATVVVAARSETAPSERLPGSIHETVDLIEAAGGRALAVRCDVTDEASVSDMVQTAVAEFGRVDILVNNAAVDFPSKVVDMAAKRWEIVFRVGLTGPFLCCKAVLPTMIAQGSGSIINISSHAGSEKGTGTVGYSAAYAATKAGLDRFTYTLAAEVGQFGIAVNDVMPARIIGTEGMTMWATEEEKQRMVGPETMVAAAVFLGKQDSSGVTGCVATDDEYIVWHGLKV